MKFDAFQKTQLDIVFNDFKVLCCAQYSTFINHILSEHTPHLVQAQVSTGDPTAICQALATNTLCEGNTGRITYPSPGRCREFFQCSGNRLNSGSCQGSRLFDATRLACVSDRGIINPLCFANCDVYLSSPVTTAAVETRTTSNGRQQTSDNNHNVNSDTTTTSIFLSKISSGVTTELEVTTDRPNQQSTRGMTVVYNTSSSSFFQSISHKRTSLESIKVNDDNNTDLLPSIETSTSLYYKNTSSFAVTTPLPSSFKSTHKTFLLASSKSTITNPVESSSTKAFPLSSITGKRFTPSTTNIAPVSPNTTVILHNLPSNNNNRTVKPSSDPAQLSLHVSSFSKPPVFVQSFPNAVTDSSKDNSNSTEANMSNTKINENGHFILGDQNASTNVNTHSASLTQAPSVIGGGGGSVSSSAIDNNAFKSSAFAGMLGVSSTIPSKVLENTSLYGGGIGDGSGSGDESGESGLDDDDLLETQHVQYLSTVSQLFNNSSIPLRNSTSIYSTSSDSNTSIPSKTTTPSSKSTSMTHIVTGGVSSHQSTQGQKVTTAFGRAPTTETPPLIINGCAFPIPCQPDTLVGDKDDCSRYFVCVPATGSSTTWTSQPCWIGTQFSVARNACVRSQPVCQQGCPFREPTTTVPLTTPFSSSITSSSSRPRRTTSVDSGTETTSSSFPFEDTTSTSFSSIFTTSTSSGDTSSSGDVLTTGGDLISIVDTSTVFPVTSNPVMSSNPVTSNPVMSSSPVTSSIPVTSNPVTSSKPVTSSSPVTSNPVTSSNPVTFTSNASTISTQSTRQVPVTPSTQQTLTTMDSNTSGNQTDLMTTNSMGTTVEMIGTVQTTTEVSIQPQCKFVHFYFSI